MEGNNHNNDDLRFSKLYELLGDDVNKIYDTKNEEEIFSDNTEIIPDSDEINPKINDNTSSNFIDVYNIFGNNANNDNNMPNNEEPITNEIFIEPTKIDIKEEINKKEKNHFNDLTNPFSKDRGKEIKDKSTNKKETVFDDGLDSEDYKKKSIIDILSNRTFLSVLCVIILIFVCILGVKAIYFSKMVDKYKEYSEENNTDGIIVYSDEYIDNDMLKNSNAAKLVNCISKPIDMNNLPDSINTIVKEINNYYRSSNDYFAFTYKDIYTGFTVSYNENGNIFAASTIKAPANIYLYEMASQDKINLDDELTYTRYYYNNGTGVLKNKELDTVYSIRTLSEYAIRNSDNAAHNMLMDKYGKSNMLDFWSNKGTNAIFTGSDNWGLINAHDATIYMSELYKFYLNDSEYGSELMNNFLNAKTKFIKGKNDYLVANKSGWSGNQQHDVSIIFADNPYIVVALSNMGMNNNYMNHFNRVNDLAYELHTEYWKYKMNECDNIKLYQE